MIGLGTIINTAGIIVVAAFSIEISLQAANIQYFKYFSNVINSSIFEWKEEAGTAVMMILGEPSYWVLIICVFFACVKFSFFAKIFVKEEKLSEEEVKKILFSAVLLAFVFVGVVDTVLAIDLA